jgi:hypothetical protein
VTAILGGSAGSNPVAARTRSTVIPSWTDFSRMRCEPRLEVEHREVGHDEFWAAADPRSGAFAVPGEVADPGPEVDAFHERVRSMVADVVDQPLVEGAHVRQAGRPGETDPGPVEGSDHRVVGVAVCVDLRGPEAEGAEVAAVGHEVPELGAEVQVHHRIPPQGPLERRVRQLGGGRIDAGSAGDEHEVRRVRQLRQSNGAHRDERGDSGACLVAVLEALGDARDHQLVNGVIRGGLAAGLSAHGAAPILSAASRSDPPTSRR